MQPHLLRCRWGNWGSEVWRDQLRVKRWPEASPGRAPKSHGFSPHPQPKWLTLSLLLCLPVIEGPSACPPRLFSLRHHRGRWGGCTYPWSRGACCRTRRCTSLPWRRSTKVLSLCLGFWKISQGKPGGVKSGTSGLGKELVGFWFWLCTG